MRTFNQEYHGHNCICAQCVDVRQQNADVWALIHQIEDDEDSPTDVLTNMLHALDEMARITGQDAKERFQECVERAYAHFEAESPKPEDGNL